jgi:hypothetical protein
MDTGKVKVVLTALREELQARRTTGAQSAAGAAEDGPVLPVAASSGLNSDSGRSGGSEHRKQTQAAPGGVLVDLSSDALASNHGPTLLRTAPEEAENVGGPELSQRPIPELVVPFFVPQEPFVVVAPYLVRALLAATVAGLLMLVLL